MTATTHPKSLLQEALAVYDRWGSQVPLYLVVLVFSLVTALVLDTKFGVAPGTVLLCVLPLSAALLVVIPLLNAIRRRSFFDSVAHAVGTVENVALYNAMYSFRILELLAYGRTGPVTNADIDRSSYFKSRSEAYLDETLQKMEKELKDLIDHAVAESAELMAHRHKATFVQIINAQERINRGSIPPDAKVVLNEVLMALQRLTRTQLESVTKQQALDVYSEAFYRGVDEATLTVIQDISRMLPPDASGSSPSFTLKEHLEEQMRIANMPH